MTTSLLRRKNPKDTQLVLDPTSAETWAAACKATAAVEAMLDLLAISHDHRALGAALHERVVAATNLTPCALSDKTRTSPRRMWSYPDFTSVVAVARCLRDITVEDIEPVVEATRFTLLITTREQAATAIVALIAEIGKYSKLVKRERAYERLSGEQSLRRLVRL